MIMGQRFSELRSFFGTMEDKEINEVAISITGGNYCGSNNISNPAVLQEHNSVSDNNGNNENAIGLDEHFESIYSNSSDSARTQENNGNEVLVENSLSVPNQRVDLPCGSHCEGQACSNIATKLNASKTPRQKRSQKLVRSKDSSGGSGKKKRNHWVLRFNCARLKSGSNSSVGGSETDIAEANIGCDACVCTGYRRTEDHHLGAGVVFEASSSASSSSQQRKNESSVSSDSGSGDEERDCILRTRPVIDLSKFNPDDYPMEDCDERARLERAREIAEGVEPPPGFRPGQHIQLVCPPELTIDNLTALFHSAALTALSRFDASQRLVHTQVDYIHCLVPDLLQITSCSFYWGKMDRYEAERLLEGRPEGTFLLRDSAQEEYLFSVSFLKELQKKWRSLRDAFTREFKNQKMPSGSGNKKKTKYVYFDNLLFLAGSTEDRETLTNFPDSPHRSENEDISHPGPSSAQESSKAETSYRPKKPKLSTFESAVLKYISNEQQTPSDDDEGDKQFLLSFLPVMKKLTMDKKMWARLKITEIMQQAVYNTSQPNSFQAPFPNQFLPQNMQ